MLVVVLMPAGLSLDYFVYPDKVLFFFTLRIVCSVMALGLWGLLSLPIGRKHFRVLGMTWFLLPSLFISLMIYFSEGVESSYYAGLNLVLIAVSWVAQVDFYETILASILTVVMYLCACVGHGKLTASNTFNNFYFIVLTGIIVSTGSYYLNRLRFREFALRSQLDESRTDLESSNAKLLEMDRAKSDFFANVSHELRTPLTLLIGPLERIKNGLESQENIDELVSIMHSNAMRLLRLINDLLTLVRLDTGTGSLNQEKITLKPFIQGIAQSVKPMAEESKLTFDAAVSCKDDLMVWLDRDKFEKIIYNLLFNAFKFTPQGGSVALTVSVDQGILKLLVKDTGVGISPDDLKRIFDRFWQAEASTTRRYQGLGIGLSLVRELAKLHGGDVAATSELGKGTTIEVTLKVTEPPDGYSGAENESKWISEINRKAELFPAHVVSNRKETTFPSSVSSPNLKVLVIDDEPDMRRFLTSQLRGKFQVEEASSGESGLRAVDSGNFSLILLDFMMPDIDGLEVMQRVRSKNSSIPIIILTARVDEDFKLHALRAGATDFLTKPFSSTELIVRSLNTAAVYELQRQLMGKTEELEKTLVQLKETESQIVHQAKMASLGQLSAGLMHEINNPLNFANTAFHLLKKRIAKSAVAQEESLKKPLDDIQDGIKRVVAITTSLRDFTHPDDSSFRKIDIHEVVCSAIRFTQLDRTQIKLTTDLEPKLYISGNSNQLVHLFINLIQNSIDSLSEKESVEKQILIVGRKSEFEVEIKVRDNGIGITPENLSRIYDAFFTTKKVGSGTGLGLNISYRIMNQHGGQIHVDSQPAEYCQFTLTFPTQKYEPEL
jgi:signal transduction histidine kinase